MNTIKEWALDDRPREKMMEQGAEALSKAELMAILIGSGVPGKSAVELMQDILKDYQDSLRLLGQAPLQDLMQYKGVGKAKAVTILAACQLAQKRMTEDNLTRQKKISDSQDIYNYFLPQMQDLLHEECWVLLLRQNHSIIGSKLLSKGGLTYSVLDVRMLLRYALLAQAPAIALCHNHPSGNILPSKQDDEITATVRKACQVMQIRFLDHVIVTNGNYYSYQDNGR